MTDAAPAEEPAASSGAGHGDGDSADTHPRKPRKIFLVIGIVLAVVLGIFLFTGLGTSQGSTGAPHEGGPVPSFSRQNVGPVGGTQVSVPADGGGHGRPSVLLFFGNWCPSCHQELPPLAAAVRAQDKAGGRLSHIRVIGVDSEDSVSSAQSFIHSAGVSFPVAYDPDVTVTSGLFYFEGDPYAVFVNGDGTIKKIVAGAQLTPSSFTADERALIPSAS
jgi:cytochrome c biogenesis protein CcmG, thiol:disulfide interchange protein DsbE